MTDFEKEIDKKRGMTREEFVKILKQPYGDGEYLYNKTYTYGDVSSFLAWNKDKNREVVDEGESIFTKGANINDGHIYDWDQDKLKVITTSIVFVGLNMSADGKPLTSNPKFPGSKPEDFWFQNARRHKAIIRTFLGTKAEGAYFTDIIKPDERLLNEIRQPSNSSEVMKIIKDNRDILDDHLHLFKKELKYIGADKPLLIVFGNAAEWCIKKGFERGILDKSRFHDKTMVKIYHYSYYRRLKAKDRFEEYKNKIREQLKDYITIP
jgi:hypothetical protein